MYQIIASEKVTAYGETMSEEICAPPLAPEYCSPHSTAASSTLVGFSGRFAAQPCKLTSASVHTLVHEESARAP